MSGVPWCSTCKERNPLGNHQDSIAIADRLCGQTISSQGISKWVSGCILECYKFLPIGMSQLTPCKHKLSLQHPYQTFHCRTSAEWPPGFRSTLSDTLCPSSCCSCGCNHGIYSISSILATSFLALASSVNTACQSPMCAMHIGTITRRKSAGYLL